MLGCGWIGTQNDHETVGSWIHANGWWSAKLLNEFEMEWLSNFSSDSLCFWLVYFVECSIQTSEFQMAFCSVDSVVGLLQSTASPLFALWGYNYCMRNLTALTLREESGGLA